MTNSAAYARPGIIIPTYPTPLEAIREVLKETGNDWITVTAKSRVKQSVDLRQSIHTLLKRNTCMTLAQIGGAVGTKDHATVLFAVKSIENDEFVNSRTGAISEKLRLYKLIETKFSEKTNGAFKFWKG